MVYQENFVAVLKVNGKILREHNNVVTLPFGSEYSIYLKNLNSRKASVKISIDGQDVLDGNSIIINPNSTSEIEGFLKGNKTTNKFKFIQKTKQIQDYRGDRIDDGLIRIEYTFEEEIIFKTIWNYYYYPIYPTNIYYINNCNVVDGGFDICSSSAMFSDNINNKSISSLYNISAPLKNEGITVKGSESNQKFQNAYIGKLEENGKVIIIKLVGINSKGNNVEKPLLTNKKIKCETCGKLSKSSSKFCNNCGTSLI